jgi:hypothetical protein
MLVHAHLPWVLATLSDQNPGAGREHSRGLTVGGRENWSGGGVDLTAMKSRDPRSPPHPRTAAPSPEKVLGSFSTRDRVHSRSTPVSIGNGGDRWLWRLLTVQMGRRERHEGLTELYKVK